MLRKILDYLGYVFMTKAERKLEIEYDEMFLRTREEDIKKAVHKRIKFLEGQLRQVKDIVNETRRSI